MANPRANESVYVGAQSASIDAGLRSYMNGVYGNMSIAMVVSAIVAYLVGTSSLVYTINTGILRWIVMFAPLIAVFAFGSAINRLSASGARLFFYGFAALMGLSISYIFQVYNLGSIVYTFVATAVGFLALSIWGYTTKKDISGWGSFLIMGVVGLLIASLLNFFFKSEAIYTAISALGVLIFAGLTAYDTQNIKNQYLTMRGQMGEESIAKMALMGALNLYLDFINMFMFLLSFLGNRE